MEHIEHLFMWVLASLFWVLLITIPVKLFRRIDDLSRRITKLEGLIAGQTGQSTHS